jgi:hypothetical protein
LLETLAVVPVRRQITPKAVLPVVAGAMPGISAKDL